MYLFTVHSPLDSLNFSSYFETLLRSACGWKEYSNISREAWFLSQSGENGNEIARVYV